MVNIVDPTKIINDVVETIDDNVYSRAEHEADLTSRLLIDQQSDNWLSKAIRPIITLWAMAINSVIWAGLLFTPNTVDDTVVITAGGVLTSAIGFYFYSKRSERITAKKMAASIQIEKIRAKSDVRQARKDARLRRRQERKEGDS
jgi:hypothetical protein